MPMSSSPSKATKPTFRSSLESVRCSTSAVVSVGLGREVAVVEALRGLSVVEVDDRLGVRRAHRAEVGDAAVGQDDVGLPALRVPEHGDDVTGRLTSQVAASVTPPCDTVGHDRFGGHEGRVPHLPALRGHLRPRDHAGGRHHQADPGRPGRRLQPRLHLPEGLDAQAAARGPRLAARPRRQGRRRLEGGHLGRGLRRGRGGPDRRSGTPTVATPSPCTWATPRSTT